MITFTYTDSDKVRATIGVTEDDLSDEFFAARDFPRILSVDLFTWIPEHANTYIEPDTQPTPAAKDQFNSDCLVLYATYFLAAKTLDAVLAIMAKESDGQNEYGRLSSVNLPAMARSLLDQAGYYRQTLLASLQATNVAVRVAQSTVVTPTYDPVSG